MVGMMNSMLVAPVKKKTTDGQQRIGRPVRRATSDRPIPMKPAIDQRSLRQPVADAADDDPADDAADGDGGQQQRVDLLEAHGARRSTTSWA